MFKINRIARTRIANAVSALVVVGALGACSAPTAEMAQPEVVEGMVALNLTPEQNRITADKVESIAALVPQKIRDSGKLVLGVGLGQNQYPPIGFTATDHSTLIGVEADTATLIAGVLGLELELVNTSFEDVFLGIDSGKFDGSIGNLTVSPERMSKYDMASYRKELIAFQTKKGSGLDISTAEDASGLKIAALAGSTMDDVLARWNTELAGKNLPLIDIKHYGASSASTLAVQSGAVDAYLAIGATAVFNASLPDAQVEIAGYPDENPGLIGTVSVKGNGLSKPFCEAVDHVIENGQYREALARWNMPEYIVEQCVVNPQAG